MRLATEQFDWQHPPFQEVGRLAALLDGVDQLETEILNSAFIERVMGCTLTEFAGTGLALWAIASNSRGFCEPDTFDALSGDAPIDTGISAKVMCRVFSDHFTTTFPQFKEDVTTRLRLNGPPHKHDFNPLTKWPIIELPDGRHLAPQPAHIYRRVSISAIYYTAVESLGDRERDAFTRDVGLVFERYVGRQLQLVPGIAVVPQILYGGDQRSVDWFVIFDELVILIETKSTRLTHEARIGGNALRPAPLSWRCLHPAESDRAPTDGGPPRLYSNTKGPAPASIAVTLSPSGQPIVANSGIYCPKRSYR